VVGGWCNSEYSALRLAINAILSAGPGTSCGIMRSTLLAWLDGGKIVRAALPGFGRVTGHWDGEWNGGARLETMLIDFDHHRAVFPNDWASTLRHEYGHVWENIHDDAFNDGDAEAYVQYCRTSLSEAPPAQPAGPRVEIISLPATISVGGSAIPMSDCRGATPTWSTTSREIDVSATGVVTGLQKGNATVRVDCRGAHHKRGIVVQ
jgi:hypothetical protein